MNFDSTARRSDEFRAFLIENDEKLGVLLTSPEMRSVSQSRFHAMAFPAMLIGALAVAAIGLWRQTRFVSENGADDSQIPNSGHDPQNVSIDAPATARGIVNMMIVVAAIVAYCIFAETLGFNVMAAIILLTLLLWLGVSPIHSVIGTSLFVPALYQLFAHGFHIALPRGWLGW